jgi:hypothetical protein
MDGSLDVTVARNILRELDALNRHDDCRHPFLCVSIRASFYILRDTPAMVSVMPGMPGAEWGLTMELAGTLAWKQIFRLPAIKPKRCKSEISENFRSLPAVVVVR